MIKNPQEIVESEIIHSVRSWNVQPNSIDLTVSEVYRITGQLTLYANGHRDLPNYSPVELKYEHMYLLEPGERYQIEFAEKLNIPPNVCAITFVRSTMAKSGCSGENGLFDSGYHGSCGMMISVQAKSYIQLGASIAQIVFFEASSSGLYNGFYQGAESPLEWK